MAAATCFPWVDAHRDVPGRPAAPADLENVAALVVAGLDGWVEDARRAYWGDLPRDLPRTREHRRRCESAWDLIVRRPPRSPLVDLAAALAGWEPWQVWEMLAERVVGPR